MWKPRIPVGQKGPHATVWDRKSERGWQNSLRLVHRARTGPFFLPSCCHRHGSVSCARRLPALAHTLSRVPGRVASSISPCNQFPCSAARAAELDVAELEAGQNLKAKILRLYAVYLFATHSHFPMPLDTSFLAPEELLSSLA